MSGPLWNQEFDSMTLVVFFQLGIFYDCIILKHFCTFSSKISLATVVHAASWEPLSSQMRRRAGLPQCWQACNTCASLDSGWWLQKLLGTSVKTDEAHHSSCVTSVKKMLCSWQYCQETLPETRCIQSKASLLTNKIKIS